MKIGVLTQYYRSLNYGGTLQAFALVYFLKKCGFDAEQICFIPRAQYVCKQGNIISNLFHRIIMHHYIIKNLKILDGRQEAFRTFRDEIIHHSKEVFDSQNIDSTNSIYDCFIVGSDQVWNYNWYIPEYFLSFVDDGKNKISYAASIANDNISKQFQPLFKDHLIKFNYISVREKHIAKQISSIIGKKVEYVVDPTLLLSKNEWLDYCSNLVLPEKYIFCYFLGNNRKAMKEVTLFAKRNNLKIVYIPFCSGKIETVDYFHGGKGINAGPNDFLALIKNATYVFTDSFHACIFSHIFERDFLVFNRNKNRTMSSRIKDLLELFDCSERFVFNHKQINFHYFDLILTKCSTKKNERLDYVVSRSKEFLLNALKNGKKNDV